MMRIHSIQVKVMFPIIFLAVILAGLLAFMMFMTSMQKESLRMQTEHYFEALSEVLNADRDIYQARLAQEKLLTGEGNPQQNKADFEENAQQVIDRFQQFRLHLKDQPAELLSPFESFDIRYQDWLRASRNSLQYVASELTPQPYPVLESQFRKIRQMLDKAGENLRMYARQSEQNPATTAKDIVRYVEAITEILNADRDMYQARLAQQKIFSQPANLTTYKAEFETNASQVLQRFHNYLSHLTTEPELTSPYAEFDTLYNEWLQESRKILASLSQSGPATNQAPAPQSQEVRLSAIKFEEIRKMLDKAGENIRAHSRVMEKQMDEKSARYQNNAMVVIAGAFLVAMIFGYLVPRKLTRDVEDMVNRIREIALGDGDLTQKIQSTAKDELGDLANEFDNFVERLRTIINSIQQQSHELGSMTGELNHASEKTGNITHTLVSASESIVSAGQEMTMSNQQMAEVASDTASEAENSTTMTRQGIAAVDASHEAIIQLVCGIENALTQADELEKSSELIASVLEVIRNIADQTNLLALNAAIEAARAGEQGRGFAVVADEVRVLATKTQDSTNEIETMIEGLRRNVSQSSAAIRESKRNAETTASNFDEVTRVFHILSESFNKVQAMAEQTALATQKQSGVADDINHNLASLKDQTTTVQDISELIQQHAGQISTLYNGLDAQVGNFRV